MIEQTVTVPVQPERALFSMSSVQPFRLRSVLSTSDLPSISQKLARALSDTTDDGPVELKISYHGDLQVLWTELASSPDAAHEQGRARLMSNLPDSYRSAVRAEVLA